MKNLTTTVCMVLLTLFAVTISAQIKQPAKASLFATLPNIISVNEGKLNMFFATAKGENIKIALADNLTLSGAVTSNLAKFSNLQTVVVKLDAFKNSLLSLSKQTDEANNITYVGRIINPLYADGYELKRNTEGQYELIKIDLTKIFVTCNQ